MKLFLRAQSSVKPIYPQDTNENNGSEGRRPSFAGTRPLQKQTNDDTATSQNCQRHHHHRQQQLHDKNRSLPLHGDRKLTFKFRITIFKAPSRRTSMYEPVSDSCVTVVGPKHPTNAQHHTKQQQQQEHSDADDESVPNTISIPLDENKEQKSPRRLPRRKKIRAPSVKQDPLDCQIFKNHKIADNMRTGNGDKCIDIDHITLERNYKNKRLNVATQTSHVVPYRLKFWPKLSGTVKCSENAKATEHVVCCCRTFSQWCLSQVGLTIILFCWALLGALAFYQTEGPREQEQSIELQRLQNELTIELSTNLRQASTHEESWPKMVQKYLMRHETLLLEAVSAGYGEGGGGSIWTYPGCILFAVSLLTTLGFGAPVPRTPLGRGSAVLFSAIGIPLHFLLILNIGNLTAGILHGLATREKKTEIPNVNSGATKTARWLKWLPLFAVLVYYLLGVILFGFVRCRDVVDSLMFPLDFTAAGGVAKTSGHVRIFYALYLEVAVTLAAIIVSLVQVTATRGFIGLGLRLGLLTNT